MDTRTRPKSGPSSMHDQANQLRRLVRLANVAKAAGPLARPHLLVTTGGKGGVGTTTVAVNLAVGLSDRGHRTLLVDADPNGGDVAAVCRLDERRTLADVLSGRRTLAEALEPGPGGIRVLAGLWGLADMLDCPPHTQQRLIGQLRSPGVRADFVVLDAGSGCNRLAARLWQAADAVLLLTTPEPASVMDAYASIKVLLPAERPLPVHVLVNMAPTAEAAGDVYTRLARACLRFLSTCPSSLGYLPADPQVPALGREGESPLHAAPHRPFAVHMRRLAELIAAGQSHLTHRGDSDQDPVAMRQAVAM